MTGSSARELTETVHDPLARAAALPGAEIVARVRRVVIVALVSIVGYSMFMTASKGYCPGGIAEGGGFIDAAGDPTDVAPVCIDLALKPSGLVYLAIAAIVIGALTSVLRRATDTASAVRYLDRAAAAIAILAVASVVISHVWFALIPITDWDGTGTFVFPFPFGAVDMTTTPMTAS